MPHPRKASFRFAVGGLFGRLLAVMCAVAAASTGLVLLLQERSLSHDLERAATQRLDNAGRAASRLVDARLAAMAERYRVVAGTPQFRATLEIDDAPTLAHFAGSLLARHEASRIAFVRPDGEVAAAAGDAGLDAAALPVDERAVIARGDRAYAVASTPLGAAGRLVAVEPIEARTLAEWSELCGAEVVLARAQQGDDGIGRTVLALGALELRVTSSLAAERAAMAHARWNLALAAGLGLLLAFGLSFVVSRGLVRPIHEVRAAAQRIGAGDLTPTVATDRSDEIGDVARAFEEMTRELRDTIERAAQAADRVEESASAISGGAQRFLAVSHEQQRGHEQAASTLAEIGEVVTRIEAQANETGHTLDLAVDGSSASFRELAESGQTLRESASRLSQESDEIARALSGVAESATQIADDTEALLAAANTASHSVGDVASAAASLHTTAQQTARLSGEMTDTAERGRRVVRDAVEGMEATHRTIEQSEQVILDLRRRAEEIGSILAVIDDVADETGLLSLNAAIIAAQAGESGRPFAVVADAMKAMCRRVQTSTKEIDELVRAVQTETANAVESIALGSARSREGLRLIQQAETSLAEITGAAQQAGEHMARSETSTARQTAAAEAVVEQMQAVRAGVDRIRAVIHAQVETHDAVQRRSDALRGVAREMQESVEVQTRGAQRIGGSVEAVQTAVRGITEGLKQQGEASRGVADVVQRSMDYSRSHETTAAEIGEAAHALAQQAQALREAVRRFRV